MPISYAVIARGDIVLAHFASTSGNFVTVTSILLSKIPSTDAQMSYQYDRFMFHYIVERGITILCLTEDTFDRKTAFAFLFDTKDRLFSRFEESVLQTASAFALNDEFSRLLSNQMDYYSHNPAADKINSARAQLNDTKHKMHSNIEKLLSRVEKVDLLVGQTDFATQQSQKFQTQSKEVQRTMYFKQLKYMSFLIFLSLIILWLFLSLFCGLTLRQC